VKKHISLVTWLSLCLTLTEAGIAQPGVELNPSVHREFRGAWIATVDNIDWPTEPGLSPDSQRAELVALLDRAAEINLNAVVLQVRPTADAIYQSSLEPWSEYLTGVSGKAPDPFYDPLTFAVEEAHRRGLELHAWFNPFRAYHPTATGPVSPGHVSQMHPELVRQYGEQLWLDPGEPEAVAHSIGVILDVVRRYDIDGVHMDDYFYPYPVADEQGTDVPFPDSSSWNGAQLTDQTISRSDWRRSNVDGFVESLYSSIKAEKPWVKVGISPFGIWRPEHPPSVTGLDAYDRLYADARKWLMNGWLDYLSPQLYWPIDSPGQAYGALLEWWIKQNSLDRHVWPGNFTSRTFMEGARRWDATEILSQINLTRSISGASGNVHFSMKALMPSKSAVGDRLSEETYLEPALTPATPWLGGGTPETPTLEFVGLPTESGMVTVTPSGDVSARLFVIQTRSPQGWTTRIMPIEPEAPGRVKRLEFRTEPGVKFVAVSAISRTGIQGEAAHITILE
jgi:uncharacterized lipoprotein YddW (UPF0748 family)